MGYILTALSHPAPPRRSSFSRFLTLARVSLLIGAVAPAACLDAPPDYTPPEQIPPSIIAGTAVPPLASVYLVDPGQVIDFNVQYRSADAGENLRAVLFLDLPPDDLHPKEEMRAEIPASRDGFQKIHTFAAFSWPVRPGLTGCHSMTLILTHASNLPLDTLLPTDEERAARVTWWFEFGAADQVADCFNASHLRKAP